MNDDKVLQALVWETYGDWYEVLSARAINDAYREAALNVWDQSQFRLLAYMLEMRRG